MKSCSSDIYVPYYIEKNFSGFFMGIKTIIICDSCNKEMDETEKSGWIEYNGEGISVFVDSGKKPIEGRAKLFCSLTCMSSWVTKKINNILGA